MPSDDCIHRGVEETTQGKYACGLNGIKLSVSPEGVSPEFCAGCWYRNYGRDKTRVRFSRLRGLLRMLRGMHAEFHRSARVKRYRRFLYALWIHVIAGLPHATTEQQAARRAMCNACPQFDREKDECRECGCSLGVAEKRGTKKLMRKTLWAGEFCPLWQLSGPRPACQPAPPNGGWGPVKGVTLWRRIWQRVVRRVTHV